MLPPATTRGMRRDHHAPAVREVWSIEELARRGIFRATRRAATSWMTRRASCCGCLPPGDLPGVHASRGAQPQEHPGLRAYRVGQDHLDQGADPRDPGRGAPRDDRGCAGAGAGRAPQPRAPLLLQGRSGTGAGDAEAAARVLSAHEARSDPARGAARGGGVRLPAQRKLRPPGSITSVHASSASSGLRAARAAGEAEQRRVGSSPGATSRACCICWSMSSSSVPCRRTSG